MSPELTGVLPGRIDSRPHFAVAVMVRAPSHAGKSRLAPHLAPDRLLALRTALLTDALAVASASGFAVRAFVTPASCVDEIRRLAPGTSCTAQRGRDLGERMSNAISDVLHPGFDAAIVIGTDIPLLSPGDLNAAADLIDDGVLVLGPAADGGYYLLGISRSLPALFDGLEWGTGHVCRDTIVRAEAEGLDVALLRKLTDLDTIEDLERIRADLADAPPETASALRVWLRDQ